MTKKLTLNLCASRCGRPFDECDCFDRMLQFHQAEIARLCGEKTATDPDEGTGAGFALVFLVLIIVTAFSLARRFFEGSTQ